VTEVGERDRWVCGLCQDTGRLVDPSPDATRALSPSIDHIVTVSDGGTHTRDNVRITHLWCNTERNNGKPPSPEYMRAQLTQLLDGTPIPEELYRNSRWPWPASPRIEYMIALQIEAGRVAADPRYGDPATRLADAVRHWSPADTDALMQSGREWNEKVRLRRAPIDARWRGPRLSADRLPLGIAGHRLTVSSIVRRRTERVFADLAFAAIAPFSAIDPRGLREDVPISSRC
jgi:hypothetical protein